MTFWYISCAMPKKQGGFRGATVVEAGNAETALAVATMRGLNPGGEAAILEVPAEYENTEEMASMLYRLIGSEEILHNGGVRAGDLPAPMRRQFERDVTFVCATCNQPGGCTCH
jgi:hypothetical protein